MELTEIKGLGLTTESTLNRLGVYDVEDLINYYPFRYEVIKNTNISDMKDQDKVVIGGICEQKPTIIHFARNKNKMTFRLNTKDFIVKVDIFNRGYLLSKMNAGTQVTVIGKFGQKHNSITASDIKFKLYDKTVIEPIYHSTLKLNSSKISKLISRAIDKVNPTDYIPKTYIEKYNYISKKEAIKIVHNPENEKELKKALERLKYEELFSFMLKINYLKNRKKLENGLERKVNYKKIEQFISKLPFELTKDQKKSVQDIYDDLISKNRMNRLLQGDVGSGKTVVAIIALYINYLSGYQGALMAPTEILAEQHFLNIKKLLPNLNAVLLKGKTKAKEKREVKELIKEGKADIVIGTHALISEDVLYNNLGLVITDEQHRFGVNQRGNLKNKGKTPDILYMSATPIPRTYALTLYGDMDISSIRTMPSGRKPVKTVVKKENEIKDALYMMLDEIKKGHQIYVVAPLVEESEKVELEDTKQLEEKMKKAFGKICKIGVMHGKMTNQEKEKVMKEFKENKIQILVSTTVIEVGVDVANATMIVIFDSYRFGLSALHQLRGRVGRNSFDSYCILLTNKKTKRLEILENTNDGFKVSEEDFKLRGGGDIFGIRQSGDMNFKLANIKEDYDLLLKAKEDSAHFIKNKEYEKNEDIKNMLINSSNQN